MNKTLKEIGLAGFFGTIGIISSVVAFGLIFSGCEDQQMEPKSIIPSVGNQVTIPIEKEITTVKVVQPKQRFDLKKVQTFEDSDAYGRVRNIYILVDNDSGKEYIGVSGIGIVEQGQHTSGKSTIKDER